MQTSMGLISCCYTALLILCDYIKGSSHRRFTTILYTFSSRVPFNTDCSGWVKEMKTERERERKGERDGLTRLNASAKPGLFVTSSHLILMRQLPGALLNLRLTGKSICSASRWDAFEMRLK